VEYNGTTYEYADNPYCVYQKPVPSFTVSQTTGCVGTCIDFEDTSGPGMTGNCTWIWEDIPGCTPGSVDAFTCCFPDPLQFAPRLKVTAGNGCPSVGWGYGQTISIIDDGPTATFTGNLLDCNVPVEIEFNGSGSTTSTTTVPLTHSWSVNPTVAIALPTDASTDVTFTAVGDYNLCLSVENSIGCTDQHCETVTIFEEPLLNISVSPEPTCAGVEMTFSAEGTLPASPTLVQWDIGCDGEIEGNGLIWPYTFPMAGTYQICVHVEYSAGCTHESNFFVEVHPELSADFTPNDTVVCILPFSLDFVNQSSGEGVLTSVWTVTGPGPPVPPENTTNFSFNFTEEGVYEVTLTVTNDLGCTASHSMDVTVDLPEITNFYTTPPSACAGDDIAAIFNVNIIADEVITQYCWNYGDGSTVYCTTNPAPPTWQYGPGSIPAPPATYQPCLSITTANGCVAEACTSVTIEPVPTPGFGVAPVHQCIGEAINFCANDPDADEYIWDFGNNTTITTTDPCVTYQYNNVPFLPGIPDQVICYDVSLTVLNGIGSGCSVTTTEIDAVCLWGPMADFDFTQDCGSPFVVPFFDASYAADILTWDFGVGVGGILTGNGTDPLLIAPVFDYTAYGEGSYTVCLTAAADTSTCPHEYCQTVHIDVPSANIVISQNSGCSPLCVPFEPDDPFNVEWVIDLGNGATLTAVATPASAQFPDYTFWSVNFDSTGTSNDNSWNVPYGSNFFPSCVWYTQMGSHTIVANATNVNGCTATTTFTDTIEVLSPGNISTFELTVTSVCPEIVITADADYQLNALVWRYRANNGAWVLPNPNGISPILITVPAATYVVEVELAGQQGNCSDTFTSMIDIPQVPNLVMNVLNTGPCPDEEFIFTATPIGQWNDIIWGNPGFVPPPGLGLPVVAGSFPENDTYTACLAATHIATGCPVNACVDVVIFEPTPEFEVEVVQDCVFCTYELCVTDVSDCVGCTYSWEFFDHLSGNPIAAGCPNSLSCCQEFNAVVLRVEVTVTAPNGCTVTEEIIDPFGLGDVFEPWTWTPISIANCAPYTVDFTAYDSGLIGYTYNWAFNDSCNGQGAVGPVVQHVFDCPGTYCPTLTITDACGCQITLQCTDQIEVLPYAVTVTYDPVICAGDTSWAAFFATAPFGIDNITFDPSNGVVTGPPWNFGLSPGSSTQYIATSEYYQCTDSDTSDIIVSPLPELAAEPYGPFCVNAEDLSDPVVSPLAPPGISNWDFPPYYPSPLDMGTGCDTITYTFTDELGCTNNIPIPFCILDTTNVTFESIDVCIDAPTFDLNDFVDLPGDTFLTQYDGSNWTELPSLFDPASVMPQPTGAQAIPIRYLYTNADGCTSTNDSILTIHPLPDLVITVPDVCAYDSLVINNNSEITSGNISNWAWTITGQTSPIPDEDVGPFLYPAGPLAININLNAESDFGCTAQLNQIALIHPVPVADFQVADGCQWNEFQYTDISTIAGGGSFTWEWRFGDDSTSIEQNPLHTWEVWGTKIDTLIVTSDHACSDTSVQSITIHPTPVNSMIFEPNCYEEITLVESNSTVPMGSIDSTWWEVGTIPTLYSGPSINHLFAAPGFHDITLNTESDQGCITELTGTVEIWPLPAVNYTVSDLVSCVNDRVEFTDVSTIPDPYSNVAWEWFINNSSVSSDPIMFRSFSEPGSYEVELVVTTANECSDTLSSLGQITINPLPVAGFYPRPMHTGILEPEIQFMDTAQVPVLWAYHFGDGHSSTQQFPVHTYATFGTYLIEQIVTNIHGCLDTAYQEVIIDPDLLIYVPNVFTPDGDGTNDGFRPSLDGFAVREYNLTIWDRWGELIFQTKDENEAWDGTMGSQPVQDGVYVWQVELRAQSFVGRRKLRGHVTVLR